MSATDDNDTNARKLGFESFAELSRLVASVPLGKPGVMSQFLKWKDEDGTKQGLTALLDRV